jgi:hypothetical protein
MTPPPASTATATEKIRQRLLPFPPDELRAQGGVHFGR